MRENESRHLGSKGRTGEGGEVGERKGRKGNGRLRMEKRLVAQKNGLTGAGLTAKQPSNRPTLRGSESKQNVAEAWN